MRKLVLLSISAILLNLSIQANNNSGNYKNKTELYFSLLKDFDNFYKKEIDKDISIEIEHDDLYNDLFNSFESYYKTETITQEYLDENHDDLYSELRKNFNHHTLCTLIDQYKENINNKLYNSLLYKFRKTGNIIF